MPMQSCHQLPCQAPGLVGSVFFHNFGAIWKQLWPAWGSSRPPSSGHPIYTPPGMPQPPAFGTRNETSIMEGTPHISAKTWENIYVHCPFWMEYKCNKTKAIFHHSHTHYLYATESGGCYRFSHFHASQHKPQSVQNSRFLLERYLCLIVINS